MIQRWRWGVIGVTVLILTPLGLGQQPAVQKALTPTPPPIFPRISTAVSQHHQPTPVSPGLEIEVLDPNVDPRGNPTAVTRQVGPDGRLMVDIPPTVLIHRYYYTGDRSFQAGLLPGGPCIVVVSHPRTGERLYVPVQLPPGAPKVVYNSSSIEYDYGVQAVTITFCTLLHSHGPKVTYRQGVPMTQKIENSVIAARDHTRRLVNRTGIPECVDKVASCSTGMLQTSIDRANDLGKALCAPPVALIRATPLANFFVESPEDRAERARNILNQRVQERDLQQGFIPTNR